MNASTHSLPGPDDISRVVLPNGIAILTRINSSSPSIFMGGYLTCGSLFDPDEKLGLSDFTSLAVMRGTQTRTFQQIFDELESAGASLSLSAGVHTTGFSGRCLSEDLSLLLTLLSDVLRKPVFPGDEVERLRAQFLTGLAQRAQDTAEMSSLKWDEILYAGHPYARPEEGWPKTIRAIRRDDLVDFHHKHYGPRGMLLVLVGALDPAKVQDLVSQALGDWTNPSQPEPPTLPPLTPLKKTTSKKVKIPGKSQSDIVIGTSGPRRTDPDFLPASLANSVLGQFGLGGRIGDVVREKSGLAYYAYSSLNAGVGPGSWHVSAGVNPANIAKARDLICKEIASFSEKGATQEELADSQSNFIGRLPLSLESNAGVVNALITIERYSLGLDYYRRYPALVQAVTLEQVHAVAKKYLDPERLAIVVAGP